MGRAGQDSTAIEVSRRSDALKPEQRKLLEALADHSHGVAQTHQLASKLGWNNRVVAQLLRPLAGLGLIEKARRSDRVDVWRLTKSGWDELELVDEAEHAEGRLWDIGTRLTWDECQILKNLIYGYLVEEKDWESAVQIAHRILRRIPEARSIPAVTLREYARSLRALENYGLVDARAGRRDSEYTISELGEQVKLYLAADYA